MTKNKRANSPFYTFSPQNGYNEKQIPKIMLIQINDTKDLVNRLKEHMGFEIIFHFICSECEDEQVTYTETVDEDLINQIDENGYMVLGYECTKCSTRHGMVDIKKYVQGFEIINEEEAEITVTIKKSEKDAILSIIGYVIGKRENDKACDLGYTGLLDLKNKLYD